jgi:HEAT repeat protein
MAQHGDISIALSPAQVEQVIRAAGSKGRGAASTLLVAALDHAHADGDGSGRHHDSLREAAQLALGQALNDPQLSQSLLRGLAVLSCYGPQRRWRAIVDLARELDMSPSTTHRYVKTLRAVGLLEQHPGTREYRPIDA